MIASHSSQSIQDDRKASIWELLSRVILIVTVVDMESQIQSINRNDILKICNGQVITDLTSAVKELIENSLDAESTVIHINLKNMGVRVSYSCRSNSNFILLLT